MTLRAVSLQIQDKLTTKKVDRTSELRAKGFEGRRLGPVQMTTDTAVRVTRLVVQEGKTLDTIGYVDHPEFRFSRNESTQMPFRYVKGEDGKPVLPEVSCGCSCGLRAILMGLGNDGAVER